MAYAGEEATIVLSGIGTELSDGMLMNMYRTYGPIVRVRHNGTNSAQVVFAQKRHADKAVEATNGAVVYGKTLKVSLQRKFKKTTEPCRGFAAGICRKGDLCKYYHVTDEAAFASSAPVVAKAPREPKKKTPKPKAPKPAESSVVPSEVQGVPPRSFAVTLRVASVRKDAVPAPTGKVAQLCQFFLSGVCTRGDTCRFIHQTKADATPEKTATTKASVQSEEESESEAEAEQNAETRTCVECEMPGVAVWKCAKCDNSLYCDDCNSAVHRARVMAKHKRTKLPPVPTLPRCGECESNTASVRCEQCEVPFCVSCDASVHKFKSLRKHTRVKLSSKAEKAKPTKKVQEEPKATKKVVKKGKTEAVESAPQAKVVDPVLYVESVPQLEFSSESSESEDEEMQPRTAQTTASDDERWLTPPVASESESEDDSDDKPAAKPTPSPASGPKMETTAASASTLEVDESSESEDEPPSKPAVKPTPAPAPKPTLAELSSESESDSDSEAPSKPVVKQTKNSDSSDSSEDEAPPAKPVKPTPAPQAPARTHKAGGISEGSSHTLVKKIEAFNESGEGNELHLDANLNGFERLLAHDCAERLGLAHESIGADLERHIIISRHGAKRPAASSGHGHKAKKSKHRH
ncbi:Nucleotide-binding alpha-beta plait domain [Phytophthora cactorum]|nr:Nucleotide-binding alpha-beta plait domain [Phytophthora cactorum]